jgi:hypothetical protein
MRPPFDDNIHYCSKVWGHLKCPNLLKKSTDFFNEDNIQQIRDAVQRKKRQIFNGIFT